MGRLRERQGAHRAEAQDARRRVSERAATLQMMTAATKQREYEDTLKAQWRGGPFVLAFLFAPPDCDVIKALDARGAYFDSRTGDTWDLFFPGYYKSGKGEYFERQARARPVGSDYAGDWYFSPTDFDRFRRHIEESSGNRWNFSGEADLVLVGGWMPEVGDPFIDWESTLSGDLTDQSSGTRSLTLGAVIERISTDLERDLEDAKYGVAAVVDPAQPQPSPSGPLLRETMTNTLGGIIAALASKHLNT